MARGYRENTKKTDFFSDKEKYNMSRAESFLKRQAQTRQMPTTSSVGTKPSQIIVKESHGVSSSKKVVPQKENIKLQQFESANALLQKHASTINSISSCDNGQNMPNRPSINPSYPSVNPNKNIQLPRRRSVVGGGIVLVVILFIALVFFMNMDGEIESGNALTSRQIDELVTSRVLAILTDAGVGSGFPITQRDVLTNRHVVEAIGEGAPTLIYNEKWGKARMGRVRLISPKADMAWIVMDENLPVAPLKISRRKLQRGDKVFAYGYPKQAYRFGLENLKVRGTPGQISAVDMPAEGVMHYEHTAAINEGNSGGPLFNECGEVAGINTWMFLDANSAFYAIEITELQKVFGILWDKVY